MEKSQSNIEVMKVSSYFKVDKIVRTIFLRVVIKTGEGVIFKEK